MAGLNNVSASGGKRRTLRFKIKPVPKRTCFGTGVASQKSPPRVPKDPDNVYLCTPAQIRHYISDNPHVAVPPDGPPARGLFDKLDYERKRLHRGIYLDGKHFAGGLAMDALSKHPEARPSFSLHIYQLGFSINDPVNNWRPYDHLGRELLAAVDAGLLHPSLSDILATLDPSAIKFTDGALIAEVRDYRELCRPNLSDPDSHPATHRVLLRTSPDVAALDLETLLADEKTRFKLKHMTVAETKIQFDKRLIRAEKPSLCLHPSPRVLEVATLANYNRRKAFVRPFDGADLWKPGRAREVHGSGINPQSVRCVSSPFPKEKLDSASIRVREMIDHTNFDLNARSLRAAAAHDSIFKDPLFRSTVFNATPALLTQAHHSSIIFAQNIPRLTISTKSKNKPPSERRPPNVNGPGRAVETMRFGTPFAERKDDVFIFSRASQGAKVAASQLVQYVGTYEGIIKYHTGDPNYEFVRFMLGNNKTTDLFVKQFEKQSAREGRTKSHHVNPNGWRSNKPKATNFVSLDPVETANFTARERQKANLQMRNAQMSQLKNRERKGLNPQQSRVSSGPHVQPQRQVPAMAPGPPVAHPPAPAK